MTGHHTLRLSGTGNTRGLQKYPSYKIILGSFPNSRLTTGSRDSEENLNKKEDRQLAGQSSSTPFMNIQKEQSKRVTFDMMDGMEQKIDKLTVMMGKLVTEDEGQNRQFKP